ncbi:MAG: cation:proton antiporter subunit C [Pseudomonadales bacterium]|nr:cation:proton antiporter subunit C [Pseudomonadales bacterium]
MNLFEVLGHYNYWVFSILLMVGMYAVIARGNLIKKLVGLSIFQSAVFLMYISMDKVEGGTAPILQSGNPGQLYSNPLPQVLILTAIVVGVATLALGLAIVVRIHERYGTIEEQELLNAD